MKKRLLIKVCGMRDDANLLALGKLQPDFVGMIFYPLSPRYVGEQPTAVQAAPIANAVKTGVFVDAPIETIADRCHAFGLGCVQLHGHETPAFCQEVRQRTGCRVIKAISVADAADIDKAQAYNGVADYLLFDTKTPKKGGSGQQFDWSLLDKYEGMTPFFVSGGIDERSLAKLQEHVWPALVGVDLNSRFETAPAIKNIDRLKTVFEFLRK